MSLKNIYLNDLKHLMENKKGILSSQWLFYVLMVYMTYSAYLGRIIFSMIFHLLILRAHILQVYDSSIIVTSLRKGQQVHESAYQDFLYHISIWSRLSYRN